jgi:hypothetical protein
MTDAPERAVKRAYEACLAGDVPDIAKGIVALLKMDGWEIEMVEQRIIDADSGKSGLGAAAKVLDEKATALPVGHEIPEKGCSTYNWLKWAAATIREADQ